MKFHHFLSSLGLCALCIAYGQEQQRGVDVSVSKEVELKIPSTIFIPPPPPKEVPPMKIEGATVSKLPTHQITVLRSDASTLPDIPEPPAPRPFVQGRVGEPRYSLSFGATVYDHGISHVRWHDPRSKKNFEAWCAWDWSLLAPFPEIKIGEGVNTFHLFTSHIDTAKMQRSGRNFLMPKQPRLDELSFVITKGEASDTEALRILGLLRDYYSKHKERLIEIRKAKEEYQAAAAAWHAANPPKPQNHTFWLKPHRGSRYLKEEGAR